MGNTNNSIIDLVQIVSSILTFVALIFTIFQVRMAKRTIAQVSFKGIYDDNLKIRNYFEKAVIQRNEFLDILDSTTDDVSEIYGSAKYSELREIGYHYEYIGVLIKQKLVSIEIVFELIHFPDKFWTESKPFVKKMREKGYSDFWKNFESLKPLFEHKRNN